MYMPFFPPLWTSAGPSSLSWPLPGLFPFLHFLPFLLTLLFFAFPFLFAFLIFAVLLFLSLFSPFLERLTQCLYFHKTRKTSSPSLQLHLGACSHDSKLFNFVSTLFIAYSVYIHVYIYIYTYKYYYSN